MDECNGLEGVLAYLVHPIRDDGGACDGDKGRR